MDKDYEKKYHEEEEKNWWFVSRRHAILSLLGDVPRDAKILDIGCGGGPLLSDLKKAGFTNIYGLDFSEDAVRFCKMKGLNNVFLMDAHKPEFPDDHFDLVISSDSLEHLKDDETALIEWKRILKKNGELLLFVPAFMFLWSMHDVTNHHFRRYHKEELTRKVISAGLSPVKTTYWNFLMFFPTSVFRIISGLASKNKSKEGHDLKTTPYLINQLLIRILKAENRIFKSLGFPIGVSLFIAARK